MRSLNWNSHASSLERVDDLKDANSSSKPEPPGRCTGWKWREVCRTKEPTPCPLPHHTQGPVRVWLTKLKEPALVKINQLGSGCLSAWPPIPPESPLLETKQDPMGLLGTKAFLCPLFLVCGEQSPASMTFPEFQRADSNSC